MGRLWRAVIVVGVLLTVTAVVIGLLLTGSSSTSGKASANPTVSHQSTGTKTAACWQVQLDPNEGNRVLSNGIPVKYRTSPQASSNYLLSVAKKDPTALQAFWNVSPAGEKSPILNWHTLVTGNCFSQQGQTTWRELAAENQSQATVAVSQAPATGCNTYVVSGGNATCKVENIIGNRMGIKIAYTTGQTLWVMYRCGNPVTPAPPPVVPPVHTPTTTTLPPRHPPTTTTTCLCRSPVVPPNLPTGVDGPTPGAPTSPPGNTAPAPDNNTGTNQPAPPSTPQGSNSGSTDGTTGVPSGSDTGGGTTTTGSDSGTSSPTCGSAACGTTTTGTTPNSGTSPTPG